MGVFRVEKNKNYTVMSNYHLRDRKLSLKARGLLSMILSLPEDWDYTLPGLVMMTRDGLAAVRAALHELEDNGYLVRQRERNTQGRLGGMIYTIYEYPQINDDPSLEKPTYENRTLDNRTYDNPTYDNQMQQSTDIQSKDKQNKEEQIETDLPTDNARTRESALRELICMIENLIGRPLSGLEKRMCSTWISNDVNPRMVELAVKDNLFRQDLFDLKYVRATLAEWNDKGITTPLQARNHILDSHVENISRYASGIARQRNNDDLVDKIVMNNAHTDLKGARDYAIKLYRSRRFDALLGFVGATYHKDIVDYLPEEIQLFIRENSKV